MKRIHILQSISGYGSPDRNPEGRFAFAPGDEVDIENDIATAWTESGIASFIEESLEVSVIQNEAETAMYSRRRGRKPKAQNADSTSDSEPVETDDTESIVESLPETAE